MSKEKAFKNSDTIKVRIENCFDMRELYAAADRLAKESGWKNYNIVGKVGSGKVLTIKKTK